MPKIVELQLTAMAHGGSALGRARLESGSDSPDHPGEHVVFVPYAIPGESVRVEITESRTRWARARLLEVLEPSPYRVEPPCPYFGPDRCGGCHFQHIAYEAQAEFKSEVIRDQLGRLGGLRDVDVQDAIGAAEPWSYRNHTQFHLTDDGRLGFLTADTHRVVPVQDCLIMDPLLDDLRAAMDMVWPQLHRLSLRCGSATGDLMAVFELDHYQDFDIEVDFPVSCVLLLADGEAVVLMGDDHIVEYVSGRDYHISAGSFFQVNTGGANALVALVREYLAPSGDETLVDLYCGVGLFGLSMADSVGRVIGIEAGASAASDLRINAAGVESLQVLEDRAKSALRQIEDTVDLLVLDPPRSGAGREVMEEISRRSPRRVVYVSCDPATLARDARHLVDSGYQLAQVQPVDMFPQTYHVESVALFTRET